MVSKKLTVTNTQGFHMRPAMTFTTAMSKFPCKVSIVINNNSVDGKSIMNLIAAFIKFGSEIEVVCDGEQEQEALDKAVELIESGLGE